MRSTRTSKLIVLVLALLLGLAAIDAWRLAQALRWNRAIADGSIAALAGEAPAQVRFAQASLLARGGERERALAFYKEAETTGGRGLETAARYNAANLYLRWALEVRAQEGESAALPLIELAKQGYRDLLRDAPAEWDARYNLERALRLFPEGEEAAAFERAPPLQSERAITTMRGFTLGLP